MPFWGFSSGSDRLSSSTSLWDSIKRSIWGAPDETLLSDLEEALIAADIDIDTTTSLLQGLPARPSLHTVRHHLQKKASALLAPSEAAKKDLSTFSPPLFITLVGVNGAGKTTTIGKLAHHYKQAGAKVLLGGGDTFRAAATDQLSGWGQRLGLPVVLEKKASSVAYRAGEMAQKEGYNLILLDTAGRLHNKKDLLQELEKIKRAANKSFQEARAHTWLVLDGSSGQNAFQQAKTFNKEIGLTGLIITKLDGDVQGGTLLRIAHHTGLPIYYIGIGEGADDLIPFVAHDFIANLFHEALPLK